MVKVALWWWLSYLPVIHRHRSSDDLGTDLYVQQDPCRLRGRLQNPVRSGPKGGCGEHRHQDQREWPHREHLQYWPCHAGEDIVRVRANKIGL